MYKYRAKNFYLSISLNLWKKPSRLLLLSLHFADDIAMVVVQFAKILELLKYWSQDWNPESLSLHLCPQQILTTCVFKIILVYSCLGCCWSLRTSALEKLRKMAVQVDILKCSNFFPALASYRSTCEYRGTEAEPVVCSYDYTLLFYVFCTVLGGYF